MAGATEADDGSRVGRFAGPAVVVAVAILYALTAARAVLGGDNGEFAAFVVKGGVAHPPGYPLYILWLRATHWIPGETPAHRAALATAILGVVATWLMQRAARAWGASAIAAALASALFATSRLEWMLATHAEVFVPNVLFAFAIVWASAPSLTIAPLRRVALLGLLAGLGISVHHTIVLLAPIGLFAAICALRVEKRKTLAIALGVGALLLGLLPYAYLVFAGREANRTGSWAWGDVHDLRSLLHHFLRSDYGAAFHFGAIEQRIEPLAQEAFLARSIIFGLIGLPIVALVVAMVRAARSRVRPRGSMIALLSSFLLAGPLLVLRFNVPPRRIGALIDERFHLLPLALAALLSAVAITPILARVKPAIGASLVGAAFAISAFVFFPDVRAHHRPTVQIYAENALSLLPPDAIVVGTGDHRMGAFLYEQIALGARSDVVFVNPRLMLADWYADRMSQRLGISLVHAESGVLHGGVLLDQLVATKRPVFLTDWFAPDLDKQFPSYPIGVLIAIVDDKGKVPTPYQLEQLNVEALHTMKIEDDPPLAGEGWAGDLQGDYARPWLVLADVFDKMGDRDAAERARARAKILAPQ